MSLYLYCHIVCRVGRLTKCPSLNLLDCSFCEADKAFPKASIPRWEFLNCQSTPCLHKASLTDIDLSSFLSSDMLRHYQIHIMVQGRVILQLTNLLNAWRKLESTPTSKYTAIVTAQVKRQMYTLFSLPLPFAYKAPVKSPPVFVKDGDS